MDTTETAAVIEPTTTLAAVVTRFPQLARELEQRGLDYCCGGQQTLAAACASAGVDAAVVAAELNAAVVGAAAAPAAWATMTATELVDHLEATHHLYLWAEMPRVAALVDKIVEVHGARHPELAEIARCYSRVQADLEPHLLKEERILFPMIRQLAAAGDHVPSFHCGSLRNPISVMLSEHDAVGDLFAKLRRLTDNYTPPTDGCATYAACFAAMAEIEADTHLHIHKENNVLFPLVVRLESEAAAAAK